MERERRRHDANPLGDSSRRHSIWAGLDEQSIDRQAMFMGKRTECFDSLRGIHRPTLLRVISDCQLRTAPPGPVSRRSAHTRPPDTDYRGKQSSQVIESGRRRQGSIPPASTNQKFAPPKIKYLAARLRGQPILSRAGCAS